jgi:hypothetical protein
VASLGLGIALEVEKRLSEDEVPKADPRVVVKLFCMAETSTAFKPPAPRKEGIVIVHTPAKGRSGLAL